MALRLVRYPIHFQSYLTRSGIQRYKDCKINLCRTKNSRFYCTNAEIKTTGWNSWRTIVRRFVPVGLCLIAVVQWRAYRKGQESRVARQWEVNLYRALPLRAFSRLWGWLADKQLPIGMRPWIYGAYSSLFNVNMNEAESPDFKYYPSLADFFARGLKAGVRTVDTSGCLTAPCDGKVLHCGPVNSCYVEQVKGITYSLEQFLGVNNTQANCLDYRQSLLQNPENKPTTLYQCILYLAPGDYHRFHSPADWCPSYRRHFAGELLSVSPSCAKWIPGLFCLNERAVYLGQWRHGFFSYTAVGATNVGSVKVYFDPRLQTNIPQAKCHCDNLNLSEEKISLKRGDAVGEFRMGSTIVLIFEAPPNFEFHLSAGQRIRMGQKIGCLRQQKYVDQVEKPNFNVKQNAT